MSKRKKGPGNLGFVSSPIGKMVTIRPSVLGREDLLWGELSHILSYLSTAEIYRSLGCSSCLGFLVFQRECHNRRRDADRDCARFLSRKEIVMKKVLNPVVKDRVYTMRDRILLSSYPRSGNSFLRSLLEGETGIITGSDSRPNRNLSASLLRFGFQGEGVVDDSVWVVKSHYPERYGFLSFDVDRVVLLVRNPFDAIESYFHMAFTNTHDKSLDPSTRIAPSPLAAIWEDFVLEEIKVWIRFHSWWKAQASRVPVLVTRFEDLREVGEMQRILSFAESDRASLQLQSQSRQDVFLPAMRPRDSGGAPVSSSSSPGPGYSLKSGTLQVGKSLEYMPSVLLEQASALLQPHLKEFGYSLTKWQSTGTWSLEVVPLQCDYVSYLSTTETGQLTVNNIRDMSGWQIRPREDKYGRNVTALRHSLTDDDEHPFPVR